MLCINAADFYVLSALEDVFIRVVRVLEMTMTVGYPLLLRRRRRRLPPSPPPPRSRRR